MLGEVHHPTEPKEVVSPEWLTLPERGLFTGIAIFGAVGSGKTSACMHPYARGQVHSEVEGFDSVSAEPVVHCLQDASGKPLGEEDG